MYIIAEVKTQSPFDFTSDKSWDELFAIANKVGDMISIHTDARWGGSFDLLQKARQLTSKPILAKGIHATDDEVKEAIACGADFVLVVGRIPGVYKEKCLIEPLTLGELQILPTDCKAVWNSRDLATGGMKAETFADARKLFSGWLCQASNIQTIDDVDAQADAVLAGTNLETFAESVRAHK
jgi:indole-3-glycerol phosphate synthase